MKWIDTHAHLYLKQFDRDLDAVIARAQQQLAAVVLPNINPDTVAPMLALTARAPEFFFPAIGLHPSDVKEDFELLLEKTESWLRNPAFRWYGIGETGIDLYWDKSTLPLQQESLKVQIQWAKEFQLPIILHARDAINETLALIEAHHDARLRGIFHCFDGTHEQVARIRALKTFFIGIGGNLTYRKEVQEVVAEAPLEMIVLETDSPYMAPEPIRKQKDRRNESSYTRLVGEKLAELHRITPEAAATATSHNAAGLFGLMLPG